MPGELTCAAVDGCALDCLPDGDAVDRHGATAPLPAVTRRLPARRWRAAGPHDASCAAPSLQPVPTVAEIIEVVAEEVPVALVYNGLSHAVMLASPGDLEDFACGFSLSERIVEAIGEIHGIETMIHARGIELRIDIAGAAMHRLKAACRMRTGKTGCGLCGIESLEQFDADISVVDAGGALGTDALHRAMAGLGARQTLHEATGATHAAGWADRAGAILLVREDVGRHNALDKLIGAMAQQRIGGNDGFAVLTSRASFEMVQKAAHAGICVLAAISAPTGMAVRLADAAGITLAGFVRGQQHVVYSHPERFVPARE